MKIFSEPFSNLIRSKAQEIIGEIDAQPDEYFESVPHEELTDFLTSKHSFDEFPVLLWEETQIDFGETEVAGRNLPMEIDVSDPNKKFKRKVVEYHVPVEGSIDLLRYHASKALYISSIPGSLSIQGNTLCIGFTDMYNEPAFIESSFEGSKNKLIGNHPINRVLCD